MQLGNLIRRCLERMRSFQRRAQLLSELPNSISKMCLIKVVSGSYPGFVYYWLPEEFRATTCSKKIQLIAVGLIPTLILIRLRSSMKGACATYVYLWIT